jgi:hypothetical protein
MTDDQKRAAAWQAVERLTAEWRSFANALVDPSASTQTQTGFNKDDLDQVCVFGDLAALQALIAKGVNIHEDKERALQLAAINGHIALVSLLLAYHADIHAGDDITLQGAVKNGQFAMTNFLLERGAFIDALSAEDRNAYDSYRMEVTEQKRQGFAAEKPLTAIFNAKTWAGHTKEMVHLWQTVPEALQSGIDFPHLYAEAQIQLNRQKHKKIVLK